MTKILILLQAFLAVSCAVQSNGSTQGIPRAFDDPQLFFLARPDLPGPFISEAESARGDARPLQASRLFRLGQNAFTLKTSVVEKPQMGAGLSVFPREGDRQALFQAVATGALLEGRWVTEGELAYSLFNATSMDGFGDPERQRLRFALKGRSGDLGYGAEFRSVGKNFTDLSGARLVTGQEGGEVWAQHNFGLLSVKSSVSQFTDNLEKDPALPRITRIQGGTNLGIALPYSLPYLSLFYSRGHSSSSDEPISFLPRTGSSDMFGASLDYRRSSWDGKLASTYALADDRLRSALSGGSQAPPTERETRSRSVSAGLVYRPVFAVDNIALSGSYNTSRSSDHLIDTETVNTSTSLNWNLGNAAGRQKTLSLHAAHTRHLDEVYPDNSRRDLSVRLLFTILAR